MLAKQQGQIYNWAMDYEVLKNLPSPYYRVATRALVLDDQQRLLVMQNHDHEYELPGGGWEYDESFEECLSREIMEELGVEVESIDPQVICIYRDRGSTGVMYLRIAVKATLKTHDFKPVDMMHAMWVTKAELLELDFAPSGENGIKELVDKIWPPKGV